MVRFTYLRKHLGTIPPSILLTAIAALAWDRTIRGNLRQTTTCQLQSSSQAVPATPFGDRRRPLLPSTTNENRSYKPAPLPTPLRRSKDFSKSEDNKPAPWHTPSRRGEKFLNLEVEVQGSAIPVADPAALFMDQCSKSEEYKLAPWHMPLRRGEEFLNLEGEVQGATIPEADPAALSMDQSSISEDYKPAPWHKTIAMG